MPTAHVEAEIYHSGERADQLYYELWVNGGFHSSGELGFNYWNTVGVDVGEYAEVRLETAVIRNGGYTWGEPQVLNTGAAPVEPPVDPPMEDPPVPPQVQNLGVRYWY